MAAHDMTYVNSASTSTDLHGATYKWLAIRGIYQPSYEPVIGELAAATPAGVYETSHGVIRRIEVDIRVNGASQSATATNIRTLMAALAVDHRAGALGTWSYTAPNGNARSIKAIPIPQDIDRWITGGPTRTTVALLTLAFDAPDATFYNPVAVQALGTFSGVGSVNVSCANAGDADAYPEIIWGATTTNGKVTDAYTNWFAVTDTVTGAETLTMNFDPRILTFTNSVDGSWYDKQNSASKMVKVKYGTNNLVFVGGDAGDNGAITVNFYSRYSAHG